MQVNIHTPVIANNNLIFTIPKKNKIFFGSNKKEADIFYSESEQIDQRIKAILDNAIEHKIPIIHADIAEEMGMNEQVTHSRILTNSQLRALWNRAIHRKPVKKKLITIVSDKNSAEVNDIILKIKSFLKNALDNGTPVSATDIIGELGISRDSFGHRIKFNPELQDLWNRCSHKTRTDASVEKHDLLKSVLDDCVNSREIVDMEEIAKRCGFTTQVCASRIMRYEDLNDLWTKLNSFKTQKKADVIQSLHDIISKKVEAGIVLNIHEIAEEANLSERACKHKIDETAELSELWKSGKHKRAKLPTVAESKMINDRIKQIIEDANKYKRQITCEELAKNAGISYQVCIGRLKRIPFLADLWQQNKAIVAGDKNIEIQSVLKQLKLEEKPAQSAEIAEMLNLSVGALHNRIYANKELKTLWEQLQEIRAAKDKEKVQAVMTAIEHAIESGEKITVKIIEEDYGMTRDVLIQRFKEYPKLKDLWKTAVSRRKPNSVNVVQKGLTKHDTTIANSENMTKDRILKAEINRQKMAQMLRDAINEGRPISQKEIAGELGITQGACNETIRRHQDLKDLWLLAEHKKITDSSKAVNDTIQNVLETAIADNKVLSIEEIASKAGITKLNCAGRFNLYEELAALWNTMQNNRILLLKQFADFKAQGISDSEIQERLWLNRDTYKDVLEEYNAIVDRMKSSKPRNIKSDEYMKWATLSKREFELVVAKLFEKMGYKSGATRYTIDRGIDVVAEKDGKTTYIECIHNIGGPLRIADEVLELQGTKYYFDADNVILIASSGVSESTKNTVKQINKRSKNNFRIMTLSDLIPLAKKYDLDINDLGEVKEVPTLKTEEPERKQWSLKKSDSVSEAERKEWKSLSDTEIISRIKEIFTDKGYSITKIDTGLSNGYIIEKDGVKKVFRYISPNSTPRVSKIRELYGAKDISGASEVILAGIQTISHSAKDFINTVNKKYGKTCIYKILSLDNIIELYKKCKIK